MSGARSESGERRDGEHEVALARFAEALDRFGPRLAAWPDEARIAGEKLVAVDAEARGMLAAAMRVDDALGALLAHSAAKPLTAPALTTTRRAGRMWSPSWTPSWRRLAGFGMAALAASLVLGFVVGTTLPSSGDDDGGNDPFFMAVNETDSGGLF